jgi:hypothetical protein
MTKGYLSDAHTPMSEEVCVTPRKKLKLTTGMSRIVISNRMSSAHSSETRLPSLVVEKRGPSTVWQPKWSEASMCSFACRHSKLAMRHNLNL